MPPFRYNYEGSADTESTVAETTSPNTGPRSEADLLACQAEDKAEMGWSPSPFVDPEDD